MLKPLPNGDEVVSKSNEYSEPPKTPFNGDSLPSLPASKVGEKGWVRSSDAAAVLSCLLDCAGEAEKLFGEIVGRRRLEGPRPMRGGEAAPKSRLR